MEEAYFNDEIASRRILGYLARVHSANERAETPLLELEKELGLSRNEARRVLKRLVDAGLVEADLFPLHVWARITPEGLLRAAEMNG